MKWIQNHYRQASILVIFLGSLPWFIVLLCGEPDWWVHGNGNFWGGYVDMSMIQLTLSIYALFVFIFSLIVFLVGLKHFRNESDKLIITLISIMFTSAYFGYTIYEYYTSIRPYIL